MIIYTNVKFDRNNKTFTLVSKNAGNILCLEDIIYIKYHYYYNIGILEYMYRSCSSMSYTKKRNLKKIGRFLEEMGFFKMSSDSGVHFINLNIGDCILVYPSGIPNVSRDDSGYTRIHCSSSDYKRLLQKCLDDGVFVLQAKCLSIWDTRLYDTSDYIEYFKKFKEMYSEKILIHLLNCNCINYDEYVNLPI